MYIPKQFEITDRDEIFAFIEANAFGQLISSLENRPFSSHIPFLVSEDRTHLIGHIAKQNPQHRELDGQQVLVTLQGPHEYISPSWYGSSGVPTWNYQAVHIYGKCRVFTDTAKMKEVVDRLTQKYESAFENPWQPDYQASVLGGIIGLEVEISDIQCKYKLGQNRSIQDQQQVVAQLEKIGANDMGRAMRRAQ